jgi:hypothetical protein
MIKKEVEVHLGSDTRCIVTVDCYEDMSEQDLQDIAKSTLFYRFKQFGGTPVTRLGGNLRLISNFEKQMNGGVDQKVQAWKDKIVELKAQIAAEKESEVSL